MAITEPACAKVNLWLHVVGRRADGYHLLDSLAVFPAVCDWLRIAPDDGLSLTLAGRFGPRLVAEPDNLVIRAAIALAEAAGVAPRVIVDCSHANSGKDHRRQSIVWRDVLEQRVAGDRSIVGVMLESNIEPGSQPVKTNRAELAYGVSITDGCIGWDETEGLLVEAHQRLGQQAS